MEQQINIKWTGIDLFGDYISEETWITVTDNNDCDIQVTEDEMIPDNIPMNPNTHVIVWYYGQKYWIPKNFHFPQ